MKRLRTALSKFFGNRTASIFLPLFSTLLLIVPIAWGAVFWWHSTPEYCVMEAADGLFGHNPRKFNKFVDVADVVSSFTQEVIHEPADKTPKLTKVQKTFGLGALQSARTVIDNKLICQLQNIVKYDDSRPALQEPKPEADNVVVVDSRSGPKSFAKALIEELKEEKSRLKELTLRKMLDYSYEHPEQVVSKILISSLGREKGGIKAILHSYGFKKKNYKGHSLRRFGHDYICSLKFFSPHINDIVIVEMRLERSPFDKFGPFQITGFVNIKESFKTLGEDTDSQIQGLVAYSLDGLTKDSIAKVAKTVIKDVEEKIKSAEASERERKRSAAPVVGTKAVPVVGSMKLAPVVVRTKAVVDSAPALAERRKDGSQARD